MNDLNFDVDQQELDSKSGDLVKKKVKIPTNSLCRLLLYNVDFPKKIKEEAAKFRTKPTIESGLDVYIAATSYWDDKGKEYTIIDCSKLPIELPLGESGFKNRQYFRCSEKALNFHGFAPPANEQEAKLLFNLWLEKVNGIPAGMKKTNVGILFNNFRIITETEITEANLAKNPGKKIGDKVYNISTDCYDRVNKKRLTPEEINVQVITEETHAAIFTRIDEDAFEPKAF